MARTQFEKNKEYLQEKIEEYSNKPMNDSVAEHLDVYCGALKAMCWTEKEWADDEYPAAAKARTADKAAPTPELDGDTEFEKVIMTIPADVDHMVKITHIFNKHMEGLAAVNMRAYNNIMEQLREVARS